MMKRREFLIGSTIAAGSGRVWGQRPDQAKLDRVAIMSLCFNPVIKSAAHPDDPKRTLDILDLPDTIAERWGVHHVEMQHSHFPSTEPAYLEEFRGRLKKAKSQMNQINLEFGTLNISSPDPVLRLETIDLTKKWIDHAVILGCPRVMVNQGTLAPEVRQSAIDTLKTINAYGKARKVYITMENRGGGGGRAGAAAATPTAETPAAATPGTAAAGPARQSSPSWEVVVEVIKASGIWANPDVGNFPHEEARAAGLRALYPLSSGSSHCHYNPERYNEANAIRILKEVGYTGLYSIEASANNGPDPYAAVQSILDELLRDI
ncbi:MAG: sugar phosphate isomerase/epimerase family protein [Bryobacteraceae bacterium]